LASRIATETCRGFGRGKSRQAPSREENGVAHTILQRLVGDVRVVVRRAERPTPEEFDEHVAEASAMGDAVRVALVVVIGTGRPTEFDAHQRAKLAQGGLLARPHAVLTPAVAPGCMTAMSWLGAELAAFAPGEFDEACDFLKIQRRLRLELVDAIASLKAQLENGGSRYALNGEARATGDAKAVEDVVSERVDRIKERVEASRSRRP
jgi:hypothetical protein